MTGGFAEELYCAYLAGGLSEPGAASWAELPLAERERWESVARVSLTATATLLAEVADQIDRVERIDRVGGMTGSRSPGAGASRVSGALRRVSKHYGAAAGSTDGA